MSTDEKIEKIVASADNTSVSENDGVTEFEFEGGLIFEDMTKAKKEEPQNSSVSEPPKEEKKDEESKEALANDAEPKAEAEKKIEEEFTIPDTFKIDEKYNTPVTPEIPTTVWRTYVPRFTEVSDTYRMKNDPRPRPKTVQSPEQKTVSVTKEAEETKEVSEPKVDPIAELDVSHEETQEINLNVDNRDETDTLNVFKFGERRDQASKKEEKWTLEDEIRDIDNLLAKKEEVPEPELDDEEDLDAEEVIFEIKHEEPKVYSIPDPEDDLHVVDYAAFDRGSSSDNVADPEGVSDEPIKGKKRGLGRSEFNLQPERDEFKDAYLDSLMSVKIRAIAASIIALFLLLYENVIVSAYSAELVTMGIFGNLLILVDFVFATAMFALALPEVIRSFKYLFHGRLIPEFSLSCAYLVVLIQTLIVVLVDSKQDYFMNGFLFAVLAIATILSAYYRITADFTAFKMISKNTEKQIIDKKLTRSLGEENMALDGAVDEYKSRIARVFRTAFVSDFFKRVSKVSENNMSTFISLSIALGASLVTGVVSYFVSSHDIISASSNFALVFLLALPAFSVLVHKLPYFDAQNAALDEESTVVGESSYNDFSAVDVIALDDTDIFGIDDVNLRRFMLYGNSENMDKAMRQMSSLFASVGGPLDIIFKNTIERRCHPASNVSVDVDGVAGTVDGARIEAGTEEYMLRHGILIPDAAGKRESGSETTKIMYAAENGEIYAKFYIRYSFSEQFTMLLPLLKSEGIVPLIYTRDPNISDDLIKALSAGSDCMRIMKKRTPISENENKLYRRISAKVVTYGDKINAINMILLAKKYKKFGERLSGTELYATIIGAALAIILSIFNMTSVPTIIFALWQIAWCVVLRLASKRAFPSNDANSENDK